MSPEWEGIYSKLGNWKEKYTPTFGFRLKFLTSMTQSIDIENESIDLKILVTEKPIKLLPVFKDNNKNWCNLIIIQGRGYGTECEALEEGKRIKNCILLSGLTLRMGFDIGKDKPTFQLAKAVKEDFKERFGVQIIDDVHGLMVYSEDIPVNVISSNSSGIVSTPINYFLDNIKDFYEKDLKISNRQYLALELYNISHFDKSLKGRFLTLVTLIESLSQREERSIASIKLIEKLIEYTKNSNLEENDRASLIKALEDSKKHTILRSCRKLVKRYFGKNGVRQFEKYYEVRSRILHEGIPPDGVDLGVETQNLDRFVSDLLKVNISGECEASAKSK